VNRSTTAREALVAELIGDLADLLKRVETVTPAMNDSRQKLTHAAAALTACVEPLKNYLVTSVTQAQNAAVEHIGRRTHEISVQSLRLQTQAMTDAARAIIDKEISPPLGQLGSTLQVLVERTRRPQWETWATYAATATLSSILTACLAIYLLR
jgi:hypothetical protein